MQINKSLSLLSLTIIAAMSLTACGSDNSSNTDTSNNNNTSNDVKNLSNAELILKMKADAGINNIPVLFKNIASAMTDAEKREVRSTNMVTIDNKDYQIGYTPILRSGDVRGTGVFGQIYDRNGQPIPGMISNANDFSSLLMRDGKLFMVSQFEDSIGQYYITELEQNKATGKLTAISTKPIDGSKVGGTWTHCAGSVTPWGTHLGSEEYEPDAANDKILTNSAFSKLKAYFGSDATFAAEANPYNYGFITEVSITDNNMGSGIFANNAKLEKHYSMGRFAHELAYVLPNKKTVYLSDDGTNTGLFRYEADKAGDLSAGTLYAAKLKQTSDSNGGSFDLSWVELGHATDVEIKQLIDSKTKFKDIFAKTTATSADTCTGQGAVWSEANGVKECLVLNPGKEKAAAFLESRRYAAYKGATTELRKEEGITYDKANNRLYVSMSQVNSGMSDGKGEIKLTANTCGSVFALDLDDNFIAKNMYALVSGKPVSGDAKNTCDINGIGNPDNISMMPGGTLLIGEDAAEEHQNDMVWAYNLKDKMLTRIFTTPYGAETTSVYYYPNYNGWSYIMSVVQHPYGESDQDQLTDATQAKAYTGYMGVMPASKYDPSH